MLESKVREIVDLVNYTTKDAEHQAFGGDVPALTTLLFRVCKNDPAVFEEATRLVELFIRRTIEVVDAS